jgi:hypothetical protein
MPAPDRHHQAEARFLDLLVLIDLDELPSGDDPFAGFDPQLLLGGEGFAAAG